jgi:hypothetical protein
MNSSPIEALIYSAYCTKLYSISLTMEKPYNKHLKIKLLQFAACLAILFAANSLAAAAPLSLADSASKVKKENPTNTVKTSQAAPAVKVSEILAFQVDTIAPSDKDAEKKAATLSENNKVLITISNPKDLLNSRPTDKSELILYADGFPLKGMNTEYFNEISKQYMNDTSKHWPATMQIPFIFSRDTSSQDAWNAIFKLASWEKNHVKVKISLGWSGMFPLEVKGDLNTSTTILFYKEWKFVGICFLYLLLLFTFVWLCKTTGLIRDPDLTNSGKGPFSLAQTQLAFWTVIVIGGFIYICVLTRSTDSLNKSILLLLGISGGTTGVAGYIDYYKKTTLAQAQANAPAQTAAAQAAAANNPDQPAPAVAPAVTLPANTLKEHKTFLKDILSDGVNISMQRTQTAAWNLVLGIYFLWYVVTNKSMPEFSDTLLVLTGVSSALYVGSKGTESPSTPPAPKVN